MQDVSQGKERNRKWPEPRGRPKTKAEAARQRKFAAIQLATKFVSPQQMCDVMNARAGTPILPRDVFTSMWSGRLLHFQMLDGKVIYNVAARQDVSQALDAISQTPGDTLIRTENGWEGTQGGAGGRIVGPLRAYQSAASGLVTGNGGNYRLRWDTLVETQEFASVNTSNGVITILEQGGYYIAAYYAFDGGNGSDWGFNRVYVNGSQYWLTGQEFTSEAWWRGNIETIARLEPGNTVEIRTEVGGGTETMRLRNNATENGLLIFKLST